MIFGVLNPEKIWHQQLGQLPTSPVYCSHCTLLGNPKSHFSTVLFIHTSQYLRYPEENTLLLPYPPHLKMSPHYLVKCTNFSSFFIFFTHIEYQSAIRTSCGSVLLWHGLNFWIWRCSWSVAKMTGSKYPCRRWSPWTFAITLLAWHYICHTSQPVLFRATKANPQPAFYTATNIWRNATWKSCAFYKVCLLYTSDAADE